MQITAPREWESEDQRYQYPLNADSLVVDCGGFKGDFARRIAQTYGCKVLCAEPVFTDEILAGTSGHGDITVVPFGVGAIERNARFGIAGDSTGQYAIRDEKKHVHIRAVSNFLIGALTVYSKTEIDLLKLNIEGMEYEVLDQLCGTGEIRIANYIQVQFHGFAPNLERRLEHLIGKIKETHDLEWGSNPFLWMSFKRRGNVLPTMRNIITSWRRDKPINEFFDAVVVINLSRRSDRRNEYERELDKHCFDAVRLEGVDMPNWGNDGCTWAHRKALDIIAASTWERVLVLEDDFMCLYPDTQERFKNLISRVPDDWDLLYLGGHYADNPKRRINESVIQINRMKTTSSYGITRDAAKRMAPNIHGGGPIDELVSTFAEENKAYILQPRLMIQRQSFSDLQQRVVDYSACMQDRVHEESV